MKSKNEYIDSLAAELKEWGVQIDQLTARSEAASDHAKAKYATELEELRAKQHQASEQLNTLRAASGGAWESIKESSDKVWGDLRTGLADAMSKFKAP